MLRQNRILNYAAICASGQSYTKYDFSAPDVGDVPRNSERICDRAVSMVVKKHNRQHKKNFFEILKKNGWFVANGGNKFKCPVCAGLMTAYEFITYGGNLKAAIQRRKVDVKGAENDKDGNCKAQAAKQKSAASTASTKSE